MSALAVHIRGRSRQLALVAVSVGILAVSIMLLAWATTGGTSSPSQPSPITADPRGAVTDAGVNPWDANNPALVTP